MTQSEYTMVFHEDMLDMAKLCHAALAQDSPESPYYYLNQLLNYTTGYLSRNQRDQIEVYLAEKDYLPPVQLLDNSGAVLDTSPVIVTDAQ
jgi:hypothetical protein